MMDLELSTPILFLIFNRLDNTKKVFDVIKKVRPPRIYIAGDGPRADRPGEAEKVQAVRNHVVRHVDWDCEVKTLFRDENLGCRLAVSTAIDWFFDQETEGIILEDDCLPDISFFPYAEELLDRYREDERVMVIAGNSFYGYDHQLPHSYFFSRYNHCWGWATWRRAWQYYDRDMNQWPTLRNTDWLLRVGDGSQLFRRYWTRIFDAAYAKKIDSWAFRWTLSCWAQSGLSILPSKNLVGNIGFGKDATNTGSVDLILSRMPEESLLFPMNHPQCLVRHYSADSWADTNHYKITYLNQLKWELSEIKLLKKVSKRLRMYFTTESSSN